MESKISARIIADSLSPQGERITTYELVFPRFILAELNTHRVFSKNSASSRAIPFNKMKEMVMNDPFIPIAWQKPHKGMQGTEYYDHTLTEEIGGLDYTNLPRRWLRARDTAVSMAKIMADERGNMPVTKQLANRLLEPFMWHKVLLTATEFENFFNLRCPQYHYDLEDIYFKSRKDWLAYYKLNCIGNPDSDFKLDEMDWYNINKSQAEIHIQALAEAMWDAMNESNPKQLKAGEWHIPYSLSDKEKFSLIGAYQNHSTPKMTLYTGIRGAVEIEDKVREALNIDTSKVLNIKISTARCARLSYQTVGDNPKIDYEADIRLHDMLLKHYHMSPFEHCQRAMTEEEYESFIKGEINPGFDIPEKTQGWCDNMKGFISYRYLLENNLEL